MKLNLFAQWIWHFVVTQWLAFCLWQRRRRLIRAFVNELQGKGFSCEEILLLARGLKLNDDV